MQDQERNCRNWDVLLEAKQINESEFTIDRENSNYEHLIVVRNSDGRRHSLYVKDFDSDTSVINCLNSYGEQNDPEPKKQLYEVDFYYRVSCSAEIGKVSEYIKIPATKNSKTESSKSMSLKQTFLACFKPSVTSPDANTSAAVFNFDVKTAGLKQDENSNIQTIKKAAGNSKSKASNSKPFIHMNLEREAAEDILKNSEEGDYLVRTSSNRNDFAISIKMNTCVKHILVQSTLTDYGTVQFNFKEQDFSSLIELINFYHETDMFEGMRLRNQILPKTLEDVISPIFINKFCDEIQNQSFKIINDLACSLKVDDQFGSLREPTWTKSDLVMWILETWLKKNKNEVSAGLFEKSIVGSGELEKIWWKLKPLFEAQNSH